MRRKKDSFGYKAPKLAALLSHDPSGRVLFIGTRTTTWEADILSYFQGVVVVRSAAEFDAAVRADGYYDLIVWTSLPTSTTRPLTQMLRRLRAVLTPTGSMFALIENRFDAKAILKNPKHALKAGRNSINGFRRALGRAGFDRVQEFLPFPNLPDVEEFVNSDSSRLALPAYASRLERLLNRWGLLPYVHTGAALIASAPEAGSGPIVKAIGAYLSRKGGDRKFDLQRFDLRDRGSLILFLKRLETEETIVCRITTDPATDRIVNRNVEWTSRITTAANVGDGVKKLVPAPLGSFRIGDCTAYLESCIPGTIAWKLAGSAALEPVLFDGILTFISGFGRDTARTAQMDETELARLLDPPFPQRVEESLASAYDRLRDRLRLRVAGRTRRVVWAHGDLGYGNAIADPETGHIHGIIDWDQGREDVAGIDLLNFLIQRDRARRLSSAIGAFEEIGPAFISSGFSGCDARIAYENDFPAGQEERRELVGWAALRFAQRYMTYPSLLAGAREETRGILEHACGILE
jgi:hypothetical protein